MKYLSIIILMILSLVGCTNKNDSKNNNPKEYSLDVQGSGEFGVVSFNQTSVKSFVFKNTESSPISLIPQISNSDFGLAFTLGCESVQPGKSCLVKVLFNAVSKESGEYNAILSVADIQIPLSAQIITVPQTVYQVTLDNLVITDGQSLGTLLGNNLRVANLKVKNNSPKTGNTSSLVFSNSERFKIMSNTCLNVKLKPGQSCTAKLIVRGDNTTSELLSSMSFDNTSLNVSFTQESQVLTAEMIPLASEISLGDFYQEGQYKIQIITIKNEGSGVGSIDSLSLPPNYSIGSNNCRSVKPSGTCFIRLVYLSPEQEKGSNTDAVTIGDGSINLVTNQVSNPNSLTSIAIQSSNDLIINQCHQIIVKLLDNENLGYVTSQGVQIQSSIQLYSESSCSQVSNSFAAFESEKTFYVKKSSPELVSIQINKDSILSTKEINFYAPLTVSSFDSVVITNQSTDIVITGGKAPYEYIKLSGVGSFVGNQFSSITAGTAQLRVKDVLNQEVDISIQIVNPLQVSVVSFEKVVNQTHTVIGQEGLPPYSYEIISGVGSINASNGVYTSANAGSTSIKVKDALNQEVVVTGQIYSQLSIAQMNYSITTANQITLNPTGGKTPYSYVKTSGVGEVTSTGNFSSNVAGSSQITISDSLGQSVVVSINVTTNLVIQAGTCGFSVPEQVNCQVQSSGGVGGRTYSVDNGVINSSTGVFYGVCSGVNASSGQSNVTVSDSYGNQASMVLNYPCVFSSCNQIKAEVSSVISGQFWIDTDNDRTGDDPFLAFCDHDYEKGGWNLVAKYGATSNNLKHWFVTSYGSLSLNNSFPNDMQIAGYANKLVRRAEEIKINFDSSLTSFYTINQLTANKVNLWNNTPINDLIGYIGVRPTGFATAPYNPGQPVRSHHGNYGATTGSGFTSGLGSNQTLDTVSNCTAYCAYRLPGIGTIPGTSLWQLQSNNLHAYVKEAYFKLPRTCLDAKNKNVNNTLGNTGSGTYLVDPDGANMGVNPFEVYCDMETDGGGWTLVSYAGPHTGAKSTVTGSATSFMPLFHVFGNINSNPFTTKPSFSRFDLFKSMANSNSRFLARRTSNYNKQISWNLHNVSWWGGTTIAGGAGGASAITPGTQISLKTTITGNSGWQTKSNAFWTWAGAGDAWYPGISWNTALYENSDNTGSYTTSLSRRSLLYWSSENTSTYGEQWFHASPLSLAPSTGASNTAYDIEFYFRE